MTGSWRRDTRQWSYWWKLDTWQMAGSWNSWLDAVGPALQTWWMAGSWRPDTKHWTDRWKREVGNYTLDILMEAGDRTLDTWQMAGSWRPNTKHLTVGWMLWAGHLTNLEAGRWTLDRWLEVGQAGHWTAKRRRLAVRTAGRAGWLREEEAERGFPEEDHERKLEPSWSQLCLAIS